MKADMILVNGRLSTLDPANPVATAGDGPCPG